MQRKSVLPALGAGIVLTLTPSAQAHVSLHPNLIPAGSYITTNIRVPNEQTGADTITVKTRLPSGVLSALGAPPSGWTFSATTQKLPKPITTPDGVVTTQVTEVQWTGGHIKPGAFQNFPLTLGIPASAKNGDVLAFPTVQVYTAGKTVRWIGTASSDTPAPTVDITAPGGPLLDLTGGDAGPPAKLPAHLLGGGSAAAAPATLKVVEKHGNGLSIVALVLGALGLLVAGAALMTRRRA